MSTLSEHFLQDYYDLQNALVESGLITVSSGTKTDAPTVTGTEVIVAPEDTLTVTITDYNSSNFYWSSSSGTSTVSGSSSFIWTTPAAAGLYDMSIYSVATDEVLSDAGVWSIEVFGGNDAYTVLLLHMDGVNNGVSFIDSSETPHLITRTNVVTKTGEKQFGTASGYFDGVSSTYLEVPHTTDFNFGTGPFTVDFWFNINDVVNGGASTFVSLFDIRSATESEAAVQILYSFNLDYFSIAVGTDYPTFDYILDTDQWYHIALVRDAVSNIKLYIDGDQVDSTQSSSSDVTSTDSKLWLGRRQYDDYYRLQGYVDELRISKGIARWTEGFDVPTRAYS